MKKLFLSFAISFLSIALVAQGTWKSDPMHSKLTFGTTHLGISEVEGLFKKFDAVIQTTKSDFSDAVFNLSVDVATIDTEVEMRDNHLRSADFFDVAKYPTMSFKSTSVTPSGKDKYILKGDLTLHGVTKPVSMSLWYRGTIVNPQSKATVSGFQVTGTIKRSEFNIGAGFPAPMISDEVSIKADGEFIRQ